MQEFSIAFALLPPVAEHAEWVHVVVLWAAVVLTIGTGISYLTDGHRSFSHTGDRGKVMPPLYDAEVVASTILKAAQRPLRAITVGETGKASTLAWRALPSLMDRVIGWALPITATRLSDAHRLVAVEEHADGRGRARKLADGRVVAVRHLDLGGEHIAPVAEDLADVDVLVFDIQDIGARFYTYIATMNHVLEAAAENNIPYIVLDRPNAIGGIYVDGPAGASGEPPGTRA